MPKQVMFDGTVHQFPDDFTDQEISQALSAGSKPPSAQASGEGNRAMAAIGVVPADQNPTVDLVKGAAKGIGHTILSASQLPGIQQLGDAVQKAVYGYVAPSDQMTEQAKKEFTTPSNNTQAVGKFAEQAGEYFIPGGQAEGWAAQIAKWGPKAKGLLQLIPRMAVEAGIGTGMSTLHGEDPVQGGLVGASGPVIGAGVQGAAKWAESKAVPMALSAMKPTVTALRQMSTPPGQAVDTSGLAFKARRLAQFVVDNKLTTPAKAEAIIKVSESDLKKLIATSGDPLTQGPKLAMNYMDTLEQEAAKSASPDAMEAVRLARERILGHSGIATDVTTVAPMAGTNTWPGAQTATSTTVRGPRTNMTATDTLDAARSTDSWENAKAYGEKKGADQETSKAAVRGLRDGFKEAIPEAVPILRREGAAIQSKEVLDRMTQRSSNKETVGLPAWAASAGKAPVVGLAAQWLGSHQLQAGIWADALGKAIQGNNTKAVIDIMGRIGQEGISQSTR